MKPPSSVHPFLKELVMARQPAAGTKAKHPSQILALVIGAIYTLVGILGFFVTGFDQFASETNKTLLGFEVNPLHNLVHLAIGLAGLALWSRLDTARIYGWLLAAGYGLTFLYGLFAAGNRDINFLSINGADNGLHLVSALAGLAIALWPVRRDVATRAT
jgi:ABC-type transport system involved in multi-copper enzyme maturation permease subunit